MQITPFLWFDKEAEEAVEFYTAVFKDSKVLRTSHYGEAGQEIHGQQPGTVMEIEFELNGQRFAAINGGPVFKFNEAVSFVVDCADQAEVDYYWEKLGEGGDPAAQQCGWLKDKYGLSWQIVPKQLAEWVTDPDRAKADRTMAAVFKMKKLDVAELQRAHDGE